MKKYFRVCLLLVLLLACLLSLTSCFIRVKTENFKFEIPSDQVVAIRLIRIKPYIGEDEDYTTDIYHDAKTLNTIDVSLASQLYSDIESISRTKYLFSMSSPPWPMETCILIEYADSFWVISQYGTTYYTFENDIEKQHHYCIEEFDQQQYNELIDKYLD